MSYLDLFLIIFFLLTVLNYCVRRSILYPPFIFSAMWLLDLIVVHSDLIELDPVHAGTLIIVTGGALSFSAGGLLAGMMPLKLLRIHLFPPRAEGAHHLARNILVIALLCGLPIYFYQIYEISRLGGSGLNLLMQARLAELEAAESGQPIRSFVLDYFMTITIFSSLAFATETKNWRFWIVSAVALIACVLSTGRTYLLLLIAGLSTIHLLQAKKESILDALRVLRWPTALFMALYIGLIFSNKDTQGLAGGVTGIASYFLLSYIVGPLAAFDRVVQHPGDFTMAANHTFDFFLKLAGMLHLTDYISPPRVDSFVFVPFPTNVYTVFKFYFLELGVFGALILLFFIGLLHSLLYLKARQGGRFSTYLFAFSVYAVLVVTFDDAYFSTGAYLRAIAFGLLYFSIGSLPLQFLPATRCRADHMSDGGGRKVRKPSTMDDKEETVG